MVLEVHCRPPQPHGVENIDREQLRENVSHEKCLECGPSRMQRGECTKDHRRGLECGGIHVKAEDSVHGLQARSITVDRVVGRSQSVGVLVPRWRAGEDELNENGCDVHVTESAGESRKRARRTPDEHASADNNWGHVVDESVGEPRKHIEHSVLIRRDDIAKVGAVKDVLERRKDADPYGGAVFGGNISRGAC